jgi:hypothetical protein
MYMNHLPDAALFGPVPLDGVWVPRRQLGTAVVEDE